MGMRNLRPSPLALGLGATPVVFDQIWKVYHNPERLIAPEVFQLRTRQCLHPVLSYFQSIEMNVEYSKPQSVL